MDWEKIQERVSRLKTRVSKQQEHERREEVATAVKDIAGGVEALLGWLEALDIAKMSSSRRKIYQQAADALGELVSPADVQNLPTEAWVAQLRKAVVNLHESA